VNYFLFHFSSTADLKVNKVTKPSFPNDLLTFIFVDVRSKGELLHASISMAMRIKAARTKGTNSITAIKIFAANLT
jgi:hypothetical protein